MNRNDRTFGQNVQLAIGDDGGHLDDMVGVRAQTRHLQVHPDQSIRQLTHRQHSFFVAEDGSKG